MSFLFTDLCELRKVAGLDPNDHSEDFTLNLYNEWAAGILEELLDRHFLYTVRTVVYPGSGTGKLRLKHRPVYPTAGPPKASSLPFTALQVTIDESANFGESSGAFSNGPLAYGGDYCIRIDQEDGGSREAILYRIGNVWPQPFYRQPGLLSPFVGPDLGSVQVISTAGYTVDTLPSALRAAANLLVARLNYIFPLGMELTSESYIDRSIGLSPDHRQYLMGLVKPLVYWFRNWTF